MNEIQCKYAVGERIIQNQKDGTPFIDLIITKRWIEEKVYYRKDKRRNEKTYIKHYEYQCNLCGAKQLHQIEFNLGKQRCACCANKIRIPGINTIGDLYPDCVKYFKNNDAFDPSLTLNRKYNAVCPVCKNEKEVPLICLTQGYFFCDYCHSIASKRPDLVKYLVNKSDAKLPCGTAKKVLFRCPDCGAEKLAPIKDVVRRGFHCDDCDDNIPYPEKFLISVLNQLNVQFVRQLSCNKEAWCGKYKYDFYIKEKLMIIETHGRQHYENAFGATLADSQENDKIKMELALHNNIKNYIVIDCRDSNPDWIKESIMNSQLSQIYDLSAIDWIKCSEFALKSVVKDICEYWSKSNSPTVVSEAAKQFNIDKSTVYDYLFLGAQLGWCNYQRTDALYRLNQKRIVVFQDSKPIGMFESIQQTIRKMRELHNVRLSKKGIAENCHGERHDYKGYVFQFADED